MSKEQLTAKVKETIREHGLIGREDHVILGLSGGPDSLCLFDVLCSLGGELGSTLEVVHVNHMMRPGAADEDQAFVEDLCAAKGIPCSVIKIDCEAKAKAEKKSVEEAGRDARYEAFAAAAERAAAKGIPKDKIRVAVAQNADDQAETLLFRLIRGTGPDGLAGMEYKRETDGGYSIIRPLLDTERKEIEDYCGEAGLEPRIDHTNLEADFARNRIRLQLIPQLKEGYSSAIVKTLNRLAAVAAEDREYFRKTVGDAFQDALISGSAERCELALDPLAALPDALRHRLVIKAFDAIGLKQDIARVHLKAADELLKKGRTSSAADFPGGYRMKISYGKAIFLSPEAAEREGEEDERPKLEVRMMVKAVIGIDEYSRAAGIAAFDADALEEAYGKGAADKVILRTRRAGDRMTFAFGSKSIQDLFTDLKIPREERERIEMAAIGQEILWIPACPGKPRYSSAYPVAAGSKRVLILEMK